MMGTAMATARNAGDPKDRGSGRNVAPAEVISMKPIAWLWNRVLSTGGYRGSFRGELRTFARICEQEMRRHNEAEANHD